MENTSNASKGLSFGAGIGMVLFVLTGVYPGSLIGGTIPLLIFGFHNEPTMAQRIITMGGQFAGAIGAALVFVVGLGIVGMMVGGAVDQYIESTGDDQSGGH